MNKRNPKEEQKTEGAYERRYGMVSSPGGREYNEDSCAVRDYSVPGAKRYLCFMAVADGMGGHQAGDVASQVAIEMLQSMLDPNNFESPDSFAQEAEGALFTAFTAINNHIFNLGQASLGNKGMGTTLTCALVNDEGAFIAHVGDTRAYLVAAQGIRRITEDHSLVGKMVAEGVLTEEQALAHEKRNVITRAIGPEPGVEIDILRVPLRPGEVLFMCTDGLYASLEPDELARAVTASPDLQVSCVGLVEAAVARGANDNVTAVAWRMPAPEEAAPVARGREDGRKRGGLRWWSVALIVLLMLAAGFGIGWGVGSIWYTGKSNQFSKPAQKKKTDVKQTDNVFAEGEMAWVRLEDAGPLALRDAPEGTMVAALEDGWELRIVSGPRAGTGSRKWYEVEVTDPRFLGAARRGFVAAAYLEPI